MYRSFQLIWYDIFLWINETYLCYRLCLFLAIQFTLNMKTFSSEFRDASLLTSVGIWIKLYKWFTFYYKDHKRVPYFFYSRKGVNITFGIGFLDEIAWNVWQKSHEMTNRVHHLSVNLHLLMGKERVLHTFEWYQGEPLVVTNE